MTDEESESDEFFLRNPVICVLGRPYQKTPFILSMAKNGGDWGAAQIVSDTFLTVIFPKKIIVY